MTERHRCAALLLGAAAAVGMQACRTATSSRPVPDTGAALASPPGLSKEARFQQAVTGLHFDTGFVLVLEPTREEPALARQYRATGIDLLQENFEFDGLAMLARAVRTDPGWPEAYVGLGRGLEARGKVEYAIAAYHTALAIDPDDVEARYALAWALGTSGHRDEAIVEMERVLELDPQRGDAHVQLAIWSYYTGDDEAAWAHVGAARDLGREPPPQFLTLLERRAPPGEHAARR